MSGQIQIPHNHNDYWNAHKLHIETVREINNIARCLEWAHADPCQLVFREQIKWLVQLKINVMKKNRCQYCNLLLPTDEHSSNEQLCVCEGQCCLCNTTTHKSKYCFKHIMNSSLLKIIGSFFL